MMAVLGIGLAACCNNQKTTTETATEESSKMIRLNVTVTTDAENLETVKYRLNRLAYSSRTNEEGCLGYEVYESIETPNKLVIVETWKDQTALDEHNGKPHYHIEMGFIKDMVQTEIEKFEF